MLEMIRLLMDRVRSSGVPTDRNDLGAARERLQHALHVLERTLQSMDCGAAESLSTNSFAGE